MFDSENKFLLCGELVKFSLKISSPDFTKDSEINEFMGRIGANVEAVEIAASEFSGVTGQLSLLSSTSSIDSLKGKKMKSVESLSNLLRSVEKKVDSKSHSSSKDSHGSQGSGCSMTSVTAKRFNSLRTSQAEAIWSPEMEAILIPLEIFIDPEGLPSNCNKATANIKVSLNELRPIDFVLDIGSQDSFEGLIVDSDKLERIGQTEISLIVLRPFEVSLRTHNVSPTHALLQINSEFNCADEPGVSLQIENVQIILSDSFTSRANWNLFKISPISDSQVPFTFETSPQHYSLLFDWIFSNDLGKDWADFSGEDFHVRVEFQGKLLKKSFLSDIALSFESSLPIFTIFPPILTAGIQITSARLLNPKPSIFEPLQIELILHNFDDEIRSIDLIVENLIGSDVRMPNNPSSSSLNPVQEWFRLEDEKRCPSLLLLSPLKGINVENIPSNGSKAIRLKFVPIRPGVINVNEEICLRNVKEAKILLIEPIIFRIE